MNLARKELVNECGSLHSPALLSVNVSPSLPSSGTLSQNKNHNLLGTTCYLVHPIFRLLSLFYFLYRYIYIARIKAKILMGRYYKTKMKQNKQKNQHMKNNSYKLSRPKR